MKYTKIFSVIFLFLLAALVGCNKNGTDNISGTAGINNTQQLSKRYSDFDDAGFHGVFTLSNSSAENEVIMFKRAGNGRLQNMGSFSTGGKGTGAGLGSQGSLVLDRNLLFAVNAGSNDVSVLFVDGNRLSLVDKKPSGGTMPISLTVHGNLLYVLNAGGTGNVAGFRINNRKGTITLIPGSMKPLSSGAAQPAQIEFSPNGRELVVTEKATNAIDTYVVGYDGVITGPTTQASAGNTPYGFEFDKRGHLIVSDANGGGALAGAMSSYNISPGGISLISGPVANYQTAPCWVVITKNGKFAYTTNTGTSNISGYKISRRGSITLFNDGGNTASTGQGSNPIDMAVSNNSRYLYALSEGTNTISVYRINNRNGRLFHIQTINGLSTGSVGLAAN